MTTTAAHSNTSSSDQALIASLTKTLRSMQRQQHEARDDEKNDTKRCMVPSTKDDVSYALLQAEYQQSQRQVARLERQVEELKDKMRQREIKHMISLKQMKEQLDRVYRQTSNNKSHSVQATSSSPLNWSAWMPHWKRENTLLRGEMLSKSKEEEDAEDTQSDCSSTDCSSTHGSEAPSSTLVEN